VSKCIFTKHYADHAQFIAENNSSLLKVKAWMRADARKFLKPTANAGRQMIGRSGTVLA
jgi:hypothetical protein